MFSNVGGSVRLGNTRVVFQDEIDWAIKFLRKDDRIVWYLSILQKITFKILESKSRYQSKKWKAKFRRKLGDFEQDRIIQDYELFSHDVWEHFFSIQEVYSHPSMKDYPFYDLVQGKSIARPAKQILEDFKSLESKLQDGVQNGRFCSDGERLLEFSDGWVWYFVKGGFSRQEAMAMRHCGNGAGKEGDILLSLREPIFRDWGTLYKPHLTFILNKGLIGEAKGFANQKPGPEFDKYIEALLKRDCINGFLGGGYLPKNNFQFYDLTEESRLRVLSEKPEFLFDSIGESGSFVQKTNSEKVWKHFKRANCPEQAMCAVGEDGAKEAEWIALQEPVNLEEKCRWRSLAWCTYRDGTLGSLFQSDGLLNSDLTSLLLLNPMVKSLAEPLFTLNSTWDKFIAPHRLEKFAMDKPGLFRNTPLHIVNEKLGSGLGYLSVANDQLGLSMKPLEDGVELISFSSLQSFARRTGIGSLINQVQNFGVRKYQPGGDIFGLGWLSMCWRNCTKNPLFLKLKWEAVAYLLSNLSFSGRVTPKELITEIVMRFGPPQLFPERMHI